MHKVSGFWDVLAYIRSSYLEDEIPTRDNNGVSWSCSGYEDSTINTNSRFMDAIGEQYDAPKSRTGRFRMVAILAATSVIAAVIWLKNDRFTAHR
jgi:hypothetical protein